MFRNTKGLEFALRSVDKRGEIHKKAILKYNKIELRLRRGKNPIYYFLLPSSAEFSTPAVNFGNVHPSDVLDMPVDPNEPTYCLCHQVSYGEMIGCDNTDVSLLTHSVHSDRGPHTQSLSYFIAFI